MLHFLQHAQEANIICDTLSKVRWRYPNNIVTHNQIIVSLIVRRYMCCEVKFVGNVVGLIEWSICMWKSINVCVLLPLAMAFHSFCWRYASSVAYDNHQGAIHRVVVVTRCQCRDAYVCGKPCTTERLCSKVFTCFDFLNQSLWTRVAEEIVCLTSVAHNAMTEIQWKFGQSNKNLSIYRS